MSGLKPEDLRKQLNWYSTTVSASVRTTAFGVIAAIWAIFNADDLTLTDTTVLGLGTSLMVRLSFVFASATLLADILQYVSSYWMYNIGLDRQEASGSSEDFYYNTECLGKFGIALYKVSFFLFPVKLVSVILSAICFLFLAFTVSWNPH